MLSSAMRFSSVAAALGGLVTSVSAIAPISFHGSKFFRADGSQFYMKGVAYQLTTSDPLVDTNQCQLDIKVMTDLGVNCIRVYHVDASANHDGCMNAFADAGIYVLADMDTFDTYIEPDNLYWNATQYDAYCRVMDTFQTYNNTLALFVGNEVMNAKDTSRAAPFVKAAARDLKAYRDSKGYRKIPVGYSAADVEQLLPMQQDYLVCGGNSSNNVDFFGLNSYSWCGQSTYQQSSYNLDEQYSENFPVPVFFSEVGCIVPEPRLWGGQDAIFGSQMNSTWSGAIAYEWVEAANNYGLISYGPQSDGLWPVSGTPTPMQPGFDNLKTKWATLNPTGVSLSDYNEDDISTPACPTSTAGGWWTVDGNVQLPTLGEDMGSQPTYTTAPTATGTDPVGNYKASSASATSTSKGKDSKGSAASLDKQVTIVGATLVGVVLGCCLLL